MLTPDLLLWPWALNPPSGLALAPAGFGHFGGDLLVGNFGDGHINVYTRDGRAPLLAAASGPVSHESDYSPIRFDVTGP